MDTYERILEITSDETVTLAEDFKSLLGKELFCGMTDYQCENGTLSDGHEHITVADRYKQAIHEMWTRRGALVRAKALAKKAQAKFLRAQDALLKAENLNDKAGILEAESDMELAQCTMSEELVIAEETMRHMRCFNRVRLQLQDEVRRKYPDGNGYADLEKAEKDNWLAIAKYRIFKREMGGQENLTHIPLDQQTKTELGLKTGHLDLAAWALAEKPYNYKVEVNGKETTLLDLYTTRRSFLKEVPDTIKKLEVKK